MEPNAIIAQLKKRLLREVSLFYRCDNKVWKEPVVRTLRSLRTEDMEAVFFGGTLRSLLFSRIFQKKPGRPRDVDIVVSGQSIDQLRHRFENIVARETRFGGLQLRNSNWQFDVWPLSKTWALVRDGVADAEFSVLPSTTFFNLEAIAVQVWPKPGKSRELFSGDDQFFNGILTQTIEINKEENPFPDLCVLRALVMSTDLGFQMGPRLALYVARHGEHMSAEELEGIQRKHYGHLRREGSLLRKWIEFVIERQERVSNSAVRLPLPIQGDFWQDPFQSTNVRFHTINN